MKIYVSKAKISFENSTWDIYHQYDVHDELISNKGVLKKNEKADVLVRSTYLFINACWESYIEDLCEEAFSHLLKNTIARKKWARSVLEKNRMELIQSFHTPNSKNIDSLCSAVIGLNKLSDSWQWSNMNTQQARSKLGTYINIRGAIAHRTRSSDVISRRKSEEYLDFIKFLVNKTDNCVQNYVRCIMGKNFGKRI